jgi:hypothetical protein
MFGPDYFFANAHGMSEGHDSTIHFVSDVGPTPRAHSLSLRHLPLRDVGQLFPIACISHITLNIHASISSSPSV